MDLAGQVSGNSPEAFEQVMVTEYAPGAGIGWHRDRPSYEDVVAVSFVSPCTFAFGKQIWPTLAVYFGPPQVVDS
jgi:alkylated DNA repair dioxygenase AlkB